MVALPTSAKLILTAFVLAALFGVYGMFSFSHGEHGGCPFSPVQHALCATPLEHLGHWQAVFAEIALFALVAIFCTGTTLIADGLRGTLWRYRKRRPLRPTLLQELFSEGILNRKEPYHS